MWTRDRWRRAQPKSGGFALGHGCDAVAPLDMHGDWGSSSIETRMVELTACWYKRQQTSRPGREPGAVAVMHAVGDGPCHRLAAPDGRRRDARRLLRRRGAHGHVRHRCRRPGWVVAVPEDVGAPGRRPGVGARRRHGGRGQKREPWARCALRWPRDRGEAVVAVPPPTDCRPRRAWNQSIDPAAGQRDDRRGGWQPFFLSSTATLDGLNRCPRCPGLGAPVLGVTMCRPRCAPCNAARLAGRRLAVYRGRLGGVVLAGIAVRMAFDPGHGTTTRSASSSAR